MQYIQLGCTQYVISMFYNVPATRSATLTMAPMPPWMARALLVPLTPALAPAPRSALRFEPQSDSLRGRRLCKPIDRVLRGGGGCAAIEGGLERVAAQ